MSLMNHVTFARRNLNITFSNARIVPYAGLIVPGTILNEIGFDRKVDKGMPRSKEYRNSEILKTMLIGILCRDADFSSVYMTQDDPEFYCNAMHMRQIPSEATLRQRMDEIGTSLKQPLRELTVELFHKYGIEPSPLSNGYVPIDIDVSPFINEKCSKEGIAKTYKMKDGYAPIFAYIGAEGYLLACELREGNQHCQKGTPNFLLEVLELARKITDKPLLIRLDSGNDAADNIGIFMEKCLAGDHIHFIIKRNIRKESPKEWLDEFRDVCTNIKYPREGKTEYIGQTFRDVSYSVPEQSEQENTGKKTVGIRTIYDIIERMCDHDGQYYVEPKVSCDMYSVSVDFSDEDVIDLYHKHGEMEQYHSEIKTDMGAEQFPSGKFETNELVLELIQLSYNMLRMMGQTSLSLDIAVPMKRHINRRRIGTIIEHVISAPGLATTHARTACLDLGKSNPWRSILKKLRDIFSF